MPKKSSKPQPDKRKARATFKQSQASKSPLDGITVIDLSSYIAGPYGGTLLADLGANVIKIEPPSGDTLRLYPSTLPNESRAFLGINRSKRGMVLNLKNPAGLRVLRHMARTADVLIHNFRPSVPARLGIDYPKLSKLNPRLIYCALSGYGESGPMKNRAGYDQVLQSMTGICRFQADAMGKPQIVYGSIVDFYAASLLACGAITALYQRERTGRGQFVSTSLLRTALAMQSGRFVWAESEPRNVQRDLRSGGITGIHPTKSGDLYLSANTPHFWSALCNFVGLPELAADPNYAAVRDRQRRANEIVPKIRAALLAKTAVEWESLFGDEVPCGAVRPIEDMFDHPQVLSEGLVAAFEHPIVGRYRGTTEPIKMGAANRGPSFAAPALGQHTFEILSEYGYSPSEITELLKSGTVVAARLPSNPLVFSPQKTSEL